MCLCYVFLEREIAPAEKILAIQSKWNPKKYAEKFVVVKPKTVRKENRNSTPAPAASSAVSDDGELLYLMHVIYAANNL